FPIGSTGAVLTGAMLMVICTVLSQDTVYTIIGDKNNLKTIFLLWGMMMISQYFEREKLIDYLLNILFRPGLHFIGCLFRLSIIDACLSALFTNDVACVILTPLILTKWTEQKRDIHELNTLLLCLATMANIGSVLTIFGNPQMALIASKTTSFLRSRLDLKTCVIYIWLPAFICWLLNLCFLVLHYYCSTRLRRNSTDDQKMYGARKMSDATNNEISLDPVDIQHEIYRDEYTLSPKIGNSAGKQQRTQSLPTSTMISRSVSVASFSFHDSDHKGDADSFEPSNSKFFKCLLVFMIIVVIALLFASNDRVSFDIGLVPIGGAIILMVVDCILNHRSPEKIFHRIDWNVLLLFFGIFVWLYGLNSTGIPHLVWNALKLENTDFRQISSTLLLYIFILIGSNIFSNVPLTILVLNEVPPDGDHLNLILYLAFVSTLAGNLTLFGSVANLIVAQKSLATINHRFTFWIYLKFGFITTIILSLVGLFTIYGLTHAIK
ncbi:unnamed protein product, partial [Didymodactylos carnosus]